MAAAGGKLAYSSRLASMGFMKRATGPLSSSEHPAADVPRASAQSTGAKPQPSLREQHRQQQKRTSDATQADDQQQREQDKTPKYQLSEKLTRMKFMQRAQPQKRGFDEAIGQEDAAKAEAEWVAPAAAQHSKGCIIIQERDPLPAGVCGRMSFGQFNPDTELLQAQAEARATGKPLPTVEADNDNSEAAVMGVSVTDDDMARGWGKGRNVLSSLRMQRTSKRQKTH
eukprot:GHUV01005217.1.p1 GENE.GHUV01005217.1~~GHUV01005217.1.p1  ORF type:complete len:227 (+),score=61.79 GHUV01005217.1:218-898(+)